MVSGEASRASIQAPAPAADHRVSIRPSTAFSGRLPSWALAVTEATWLYVMELLIAERPSDSPSPQAVATNSKAVKLEITCSRLLVELRTSGRD